MGHGVLFISPLAEDADTLSEMLGSVAIPFERAHDLKTARQRLETEAFGVILTEARLPDGSWVDVIQLVRQMKRGSAVVVTDHLADADFWVDVLELGAYDVLPKPFSSAEVQRILANALHEPPQLTITAPAA